MLTSETIEYMIIAQYNTQDNHEVNYLHCSHFVRETKADAATPQKLADSQEASPSLAGNTMKHALISTTETFKRTEQSSLLKKKSQ